MTSRDDRLVVTASHSPRLARSFGLPVADEVLDALATARAIVQDFAPDLVVLFGPDHRRAFRQVVPQFAIVTTATSRGDRGSPIGRYDVPSDLALHLAERVTEQGLDVAVAREVALDHGFGLTALDLLDGVDVVPTIPVFVNAVTPPLPTYRRAALLGQVVGEALSGYPGRVLFVGSGGLAHDLPGFYVPDDGVERTEDELVAHYAHLNEELRRPGFVVGPEWDHELLAGLATARSGWLDAIGVDVAERAGNGANEALSWVAAWGAGGEPLSTLVHDYTTEFGGNGTAVAATASAVAAHGGRLASAHA